MFVSIKVNGQLYQSEVKEQQLLVDFLREDARLTGTKSGCDTGQCGACTILLDGVSVKSCMILAPQANGKAVTTIEGLSTSDQRHPLQVAFKENHALQCGFCTPGMVLLLVDQLQRHPRPSEAEIRQWLDGVLCRCTGYQNIVKAVQAAAWQIETAKVSAHSSERKKEILK
ncbi:(2Fe-2S)-binding protein [cf. Phormidesmis sp. LEGE 11477]|uniref:(2Fe-2S)-binding protein n=1 Tax=cf. Phormidesmis sp. LEGE 11477 TaxID=1828680 RepID=UPI00187FFC76|nr:(2Fe-2S)-binding protein [cf. Phormidesmis sp. LEGE 11477]MBE9063005.1 (2Fe-2S)-binding protein [cf. Phormidesmis sp. LEGE 11477]